MKYFFDTEFLDDGRVIDLISIGITCQDGCEYYAVSAEFDEAKATPWLREHVLNHIPKTLRRQVRKDIALGVIDFFNHVNEPVELYGWYSAYDWVALCQLYGPMIDRPSNFPKLATDLKTVAEFHQVKKISKSGFTRHNALEDARWNKFAYHEIHIQASRNP